MKLKRLFILLVITGVVLAGCYTPPPATASVSQPLPIITVVNATGYLGYYLYVSPVTQDTWGDDVLDRDQVLRNGDSVRVRLANPLNQVNRYDFRLIDLDGDSYEIRNRLVREGDTIVFRFSDITSR